MKVALMFGLPVLHYATGDLPEKHGFELWRELMATTYALDRATPASPLPRGEAMNFLLGDLVATRSRFTAQHGTRNKRLVDTTPDHVIVTQWLSGGEVGGHPSSSAGHVTLMDRRRRVDARFAASDTFGILLPRSLLAGIDLDKYHLRLDAPRSRLLAARLKMLYRQLPHLRADEASRVAEELVAFLRRLLDSSEARDVLEGAELDTGLFAMAETVLRADPGASFTPQVLAERLGVSRATLFRAFAPVGGVMRHLQEVRLQAVAAALGDPLERRSLTRLSAEAGFANLPHLSLSFRTRYGLPPREWRARRVARILQARELSADRGRQILDMLGRGAEG